MAVGTSFIAALAALVSATEVSIHKVDYPEVGLCGEEHNVEKSQLNPHYFFPMHFGGFHEGPCSDEGYTVFAKKVQVAMHPVPGVHHNLTFYLYSKPKEVVEAEDDAVQPVYAPIASMSLVDPSRKNRNVHFKVCMPEASSNSSEKLPLYIFGHGFDCKPDDYAYFCKVAVTILPYGTNSTFLDTNTQALADDAAFLSREVPKLAQQDPSFMLHGKLDGSVLLGGHSMGGGTSVLAASKSAAMGMAVFAPGLYTLPPAKPYLKDIKMPALIVSGSDDCGPNQLPKQAKPAFDGLASETKVLVSLNGANHCQWTSPTKGEIGVCNVPKAFKECALIDPDTQHSLGIELFGAFLSGLRGSWEDFEQALALGEKNGKWTYFSSKTSPATKVLHNDCPCKKGIVV